MSSSKLLWKIRHSSKDFSKNKQHIASKDGKQSLVNKSSIEIWFAKIRMNLVMVSRGHGYKQLEVEEADSIILRVERAKWDKPQLFLGLDLKVLQHVTN